MAITNLTVPSKTRVYQNETVDSRRWEEIPLRNDDIIIATAPKVGTTWMQRIVSLLIHQNPEELDAAAMSAPWLDAVVFESFEDIKKRINRIEHRRFFKTHIPLDGLDYNKQVKYIHISRDTRDVFMSMLNHWSLISEYLVKHKRKHPPLFETQGDIHEKWKNYTSRSTFNWEKDGWPYWSNYAYTESFWNFRTYPNIHFVHYNDLLKNLKHEIRKIIEYLEIEGINEDLLEQITKASTFKEMKKNGDKLLPSYQKVFKGGARSFLNQGKIGRWKEWFNKEDLAHFEKMRSHYNSEMVEWIDKE